MLEYLRNAADKPVAKILIGILAFSFIGWGVAEWIFGGAVGDNTLVRVGGHPIEINQFSNAKSQELSYMSREEQRAVYTDPVATQEFNNKILKKLTTQQMAENRAHDLGFVVSEHKIAREIRQFPEFQDNGQFSAFLFDSVLANSGLSEAGFANYLRSQILRSMVLGSVSVPVAVPEFAVAAAYNARYATRDIEYVAVPYSEFDVGAPTDEQLRSFYAQNPHIVPEVRTVSYVLVPAKMDQPDQYEAALVTAQHVEDDIIAGETLADTAKRHDVKFVNVGEIKADNAAIDDIMDAAMISRTFHMDEGTESELIETKQGFVIARVDKVVPEHNAEYDAVKDGLVSGWRTAEQKKQAYVRANDILVDLNNGTDMKGKKSATVSRASGAPLEVLSATFAGKSGANSIVESGDAFYVLHIGDEVMPTIDDKKASELRTELQKTMTQAFMDDYNAFLIREYPVKVNEKVYNRFLGK